MNSAGSGPLEALLAAAKAAGGRGAAPIERWNPPDCGEIDIRIAADGTWFHEGSPIGRMALVRLFASVLGRENGRYVLVTPAEKLGIRVDDAPFLAVEMAVEASAAGERLVFRTNLDDVIVCDDAHPLRFEPEPGTGGLRPYLHVRRDLWARLTRPVYLELVERAEEREVAGERVIGIASAGCFFPMASAAVLDAAS